MVDTQVENRKIERQTLIGRKSVKDEVVEEASKMKFDLFNLMIRLVDLGTVIREGPLQFFHLV